MSTNPSEPATPKEPMSLYDKVRQGELFEGWAFTFCKAAFLVLIFQKYSLLALSGLAALFYVLAAVRGVKKWKCWAKPPYVTMFWGAIFLWSVYFLVKGR
jgi:hypothetical protein